MKFIQLLYNFLCLESIFWRVILKVVPSPAALGQAAARRQVVGVGSKGTAPCCLPPQSLCIPCLSLQCLYPLLPALPQCLSPPPPAPA